MKFTIGSIKAKTDRWPDKGQGYGDYIAMWVGEQMRGRYKVENLFQTWRIEDGDAPQESRYKKIALVGDETVEILGAKFGQRDGIIFMGETSNAPGLLGTRVTLEINIRAACDNFSKDFSEGINRVLVDPLVVAAEMDTRALAAGIKARTEELVKEKAVEVQQERAATTPTWGDW